MAELIPVQYVGSKPRKTDTVAHTTTVWHGKGDVQEVEPAVAKRLLEFPEVWRKPKGAKASAGLGDVQADPAGAQKDDAPQSLHERLKAVISTLDGGSFAEGGRPRKSAVVEALGEDVSVADIAAAWEEVQAERGAE